MWMRSSLRFLHWFESRAMQRYQQSEHWLRPSSPPSYKTQFDFHLRDNDELPTSELRRHFTPLSEAFLIKVQHLWLGAQRPTVDQIIQTTKHDHDNQETAPWTPELLPTPTNLNISHYQPLRRQERKDGRKKKGDVGKSNEYLLSYEK